MVSVHPPVTKLKRIALDLLFPQWCIGCGREGNYICDKCRQSLPRVLSPICPRCGKPQSDGALCPACGESSPGIDGIRSPFLFDGVIRKAVHELKYHNIKTLAEPMAELLYDYLLENQVPGEILVPVPLHSKRLRERGYNQSALLAKQLGRLTGMTVIDGCLIRRQHTPPQARTANIEERRTNVINAFSCSNRELEGKQVILIDDVTTSGTTLNACAETLKKSGAASVWGLVMAIEP
jgi:ComF family protein